jgi:hypothetical protein
MTKAGKVILAVVLLGVTILVVGWGLLSLLSNEEFIKLEISTNKQEYQVGEIIQVHIQNWDDHTIDIYCYELRFGKFSHDGRKISGWRVGIFGGFLPEHRTIIWQLSV